MVLAQARGVLWHIIWLLLQTVDNDNSCLYTKTMNAFHFPSQESLGFMTATADRLMSAALRRAMKEDGVGLTSEQWGTLVILWEKDGCTQDELAADLCVDKSSMSRVLSLMEDGGLITRSIDPANARRKIIRASDTAFALQQRSLDVARRVIAEALDGVNAAELEACFKVLDTVKKNLRNTGK